MPINIEYKNIENEYLEKEYKRFDGLRNEIIHIECGPNSKDIETDDVAEGIKFSIPFYKTGIKLLMKKTLIDKISNFAENKKAEILKSLTIVTVNDTTTYRRLSEENSLATETKDTRKEAIEFVLNQNQIGDQVVYASDAPIIRTIIKQGIKKEKKFSDSQKFKDYGVFSQEADTYITKEKTEEYAIAVKEGNSSGSLIEIIDLILKNPSAKLEKAKQEIRDFENQKYKIEDDSILQRDDSSILPIVLIFCLLLVCILGIVALIAIASKLRDIAFKLKSKKNKKTMTNNHWQNNQKTTKGNNHIAGRDITINNNTFQNPDIAQDIKVYLLGKTEIYVYILGKTGSGSIAGLSTKVIKT